VSREVYAGSSAYSCLTILPDQTIGCLYERDGYNKITLARFSLEWLTRGEDAIQLDKAHAPVPPDQAENVPVRKVLSWRPGQEAALHRVYLGTGPELSEADFRREQQETTYDPGLLDFETSYFWRIDEVLDGGQHVPGTVWAFTTADLVCGSRLGADMNGDCLVDIEDLTVLVDHWLMDRTVE